MLKHKILSVLIPILAIIIILGATYGRKMIDKYTYSKEEMDLTEYFHLGLSGQVAMIHQDEILEEKALLQDGEYYLPLDFVQKNLNSRFYQDLADSLLLYSTPTELFEIPLDSARYSVSGEGREHAFAICIAQGEEWYVSLTFLRGYSNLEYEVFNSPDRLQIYTHDQSSMAAIVTKDTNVRYQGGIKSPILKPVTKDSSVVLLEEMENWSKIKTDDGVIGYVENKYLEGDADRHVTIPQSYVQPEYESLNRDHPISLVWHQVTNETANGGAEELLGRTSGVNTISPTWFFLKDNSGNFESLASQEYVEMMHEKNIEVWALIDNFTYDVDIARILGRISNRKNLINALMREAKEVELDGINIDFEQVPIDAGGDYVQFLRELSIACRKNGLVLSVDNYVPTSYTEHYDRREQGTVVDYVIIMGYDEHYAGSQEAGSVASIGYVKQGIEKTIAVVPSHKVINGIPFYTRLWKLADGVSSEALSMSAARNALAEQDVSASWDEETCQNYASYETEEAAYRIWLEDAESISAKLNVMAGYNLGGVAAWKLGLEDEEVWELIEKYLIKCQETLGQDVTSGVDMTVEETLPAAEGENGASQTDAQKEATSDDDADSSDKTETGADGLEEISTD